MLNSGIKKEEYRELKPFWIKRLMKNSDLSKPEFKKFERVVFANGGHFGDVPKSTFSFKGITIGEGKSEWGAAPGIYYFRIKVS